MDVFVHNWRNGWKWLSGWAFILIGYISVYGVPSEILTLVPEANQAKATAILALVGLICRFINQSQATALPPATEEQ